MAFIILIITPIICIYFWPQKVTPETPGYSFDLPIEGYVTDKFDETPTVANLEGLNVKVYVVDDSAGSGMLYKETTTTTASAGGRFRTAQTYQSGWWVLFIVNGAAGGKSYQNASVICQLPTYSQEYPPTYHYLSSILPQSTVQLKYNPTLLPRAYGPTGASLTVDGVCTTGDYDISTSGSLTTLTLEIYNSVDESGLGSWYDYEEATARTNVFVLTIPRYITGTTAAVGQTGAIITSSSTPLTCAKQPTSAQDGVWVAELSDDCIDVNKNQATGLYTTRNSVEFEVTFDFSSCGGSANFSIEWSCWKNTDYSNWVSAGLDTNYDTEMYAHGSYKLVVVA